MTRDVEFNKWNIYFSRIKITEGNPNAICAFMHMIGMAWTHLSFCGEYSSCVLHYHRWYEIVRTFRCCWLDLTCTVQYFFFVAPQAISISLRRFFLCTNILFHFCLIRSFSVPHTQTHRNRSIWFILFAHHQFSVCSSVHPWTLSSQSSTLGGFVRLMIWRLVHLHLTLHFHLHWRCVCMFLGVCSLKNHILRTKHDLNAVITSLFWRKQATWKITICDSFNKYDQKASRSSFEQQIPKL